ncbi:MAG: cytochrome c maturation protein CcmE [Acidobacteriota bacterium]
MSVTGIKIGSIFLAIGAGIGMLVVQTARSSTVYYQTLPEWQAKGRAARAGAQVRISGYVEPGSIVREAGKPLRFVMEDKAKSARMTVAYGDVVPDTFKDGAEVVVEGEIGSDDTFMATTLLAKCPSKYESAEGASGRGTLAQR